MTDPPTGNRGSTTEKQTNIVIPHRHACQPTVITESCHRERRISRQRAKKNHPKVRAKLTTTAFSIEINSAGAGDINHPLQQQSNVASAKCRLGAIASQRQTPATDGDLVGTRLERDRYRALRRQPAYRQSQVLALAVIEPPSSDTPSKALASPELTPTIRIAPSLSRLPLMRAKSHPHRWPRQKYSTL